MSNNECFLEALLKYQTLAPQSPEVQSVVAEGERVKKILEAEFDPRPLHLKEGGSKAKGTMVKASYDYDIGFYVDANDTSLGSTLKEISDNAVRVLGVHYEIKPKTIAMQLISKAIDKKGQPVGIDLIVGRFVDESRGQANVMFRGQEKEWLKTNIDVHVNHVLNSGCVEIIKLGKIWKWVRGLEELKTFPIELATIKVLGESGAPSAGLSDRMLHVFNRFAEGAESIAIEDPSNPSGNDLSRIFGPSERALLKMEARAAVAAFKKGGWKQVFGDIPPSDTRTRSAMWEVGSGSLPPVKPWST